MRNDFVESLNGHMRDEPLNETLFRNMAHARIVIREWAKACNEERPHSALGCQTPTRSPSACSLQSTATLRNPHASCGCRLLHLCQSTYQPKGLRFQTDESSVAGHQV